MNDNAPVFIMRMATEKDTDAVIEFYRGNQHGSVYLRREDIYRQRVKDNAVVLITDEQGKILGASIAHPSPYNDFKNTDYIEFGSTRMVGVPKGFPFYEHLLAAQVVHQFLYYPPKERVIADVHTDNPKVIERLTQNVGFANYTPAKDLLAAKKAMVDPNEVKSEDDMKPAAWFQCGVEAVPQNARLLMERLRNPVLSNSRDPSVKIRLDISQLPCFKQGPTLVSSLSHENFGNPANPNPKLKWMSFRNLWTKSHFKQLRDRKLRP